MTILERAGTTRRIRIDASQFADDLAKLVAERDPVDLVKARESAGAAVGEAAELARQSLERAAERARVLRGDIARSGDRVSADNPLDEIGQRIRGVATTTAIRAIIARLERELPDKDRDPYARAYARGRVQARSLYLALGITAGVAAGVTAAVVLDPRHGRERRERIRTRAGALTAGLGSRAGSVARTAQERIRTVAQDRGLAEPEVAIPATGGTVAEDVPAVTLPEGAIPVMAAAAAVPAEAEAAPGAETAAPSDPA